LTEQALITRNIQTDTLPKCDEDVILKAMHRIIHEQMDPSLVKSFKATKVRKSKVKKEEKIQDAEDQLP
jgi:hypothetical protein